MIKHKYFFGSDKRSLNFLKAIYTHNNEIKVVTLEPKKTGRGRKITPNPVPESALADIAAWKTAYGPYHGSQAPAVTEHTFTLDSDGKSAIVSLTYEDQDTAERHGLTEPEDYSDEYDVIVQSAGEV